MTYNEVIPLATARNYLRIDDDFFDDDESIERMVRSALEFIEKRTNHIFQLRTDVVYHRGECNRYLDIYDYPLSYTGSETMLMYSDKVRFKAETVTMASVGYQSIADVPSALIDAALQIVKVYYFEAEKQENTTLIPRSVHEVLGAYRRFTV